MRQNGHGAGVGYQHTSPCIPAQALCCCRLCGSSCPMAPSGLLHVHGPCSQHPPAPQRAGCREQPFSKGKEIQLQLLPRRAQPLQDSGRTRRADVSAARRTQELTRLLRSLRRGNQQPLPPGETEPWLLQPCQREVHGTTLLPNTSPHLPPTHTWVHRWGPSVPRYQLLPCSQTPCAHMLPAQAGRS